MNPFTPVNSCDGRFSSSLDVRFTKACDNACAFCIERPGLGARPMDVQAMVDSALADPHSTVLILGGEPLLYLDKVIAFVKAVRSAKSEVFVTTSLPRLLAGRVDSFLELVSLLDGINISLAHYDFVRNNDLLLASSRYDRIGFLAQLLSFPDFAFKARVSINLMAGGIDRAEDLTYFLDLLSQMGCAHVKLNELQGVPDLFVSYESIMGVKLPSPFAHGCQEDLEPVGSMRVTLKRSCFLVEPSLQASAADLVKIAVRKLLPVRPSTQSVLYEDGFVADGWLPQSPASS